MYISRTVNSSIDNYELGVALSEIYDFTWDILCDWYIELCKARLADKGSEAAHTAAHVLVYVLTQTLKLLHPYMPFITEEIYQSLPHADESIMISAYPKFDESLVFTKEAVEMERVIGAIKAIRARRAEMNVAPSRKAKLYMITPHRDTFAGAEQFFIRLASASGIEFVDTYASDDAVSIVTDSATVFIPLSDMIDFEKERIRLLGEIKKNDGEIERIEKKLSNEGFVSKAPAQVIEGERAKLEKYRATKAALAEALAKLG